MGAEPLLRGHALPGKEHENGRPATSESLTQCASCVTPGKHLSELQFSHPKNRHNDNMYLAGLQRGSNEKHIRNWHMMPGPWKCSGSGVLVILRAGVSIDCFCFCSEILWRTSNLKELQMF